MIKITDKHSIQYIYTIHKYTDKHSIQYINTIHKYNIYYICHTIYIV